MRINDNGTYRDMTADEIELYNATPQEVQELQEEQIAEEQMQTESEGI